MLSKKPVNPTKPPAPTVPQPPPSRPIPDTPPPTATQELHNYKRAELAGAPQVALFQQRVKQYFFGRPFTDCVPILIWLLRNWPAYGAFCLDYTNQYVCATMRPPANAMRFKHPEHSTRCLHFLWDVFSMSTWTFEYRGGKAVVHREGFCQVWVETEKAFIERRLAVGYAPREFKTTRAVSEEVVEEVEEVEDTEGGDRGGEGEEDTEGEGYWEWDDPPLLPTSPHGSESRPVAGEVVLTIKDMRQAAKKITAKEFLGTDVTAMLRKTDITSLVERYFTMVEKGEFKFLSKSKMAGGAGLGGLI